MEGFQAKEFYTSLHFKPKMAILGKYRFHFDHVNDNWMSHILCAKIDFFFENVILMIQLGFKLNASISVSLHGFTAAQLSAKYFSSCLYKSTYFYFL